MTELQEALLQARDSLKRQISESLSVEQLRELKVAYLGKKGVITSLQKILGKLTAEERPKAGKVINEVEEEIASTLEHLIEAGLTARREAEELAAFVDVTQPSRGALVGSGHPVVQVTFDVLEVLTNLGFRVASGPEIETDYYCFEALNIPKHRPARDLSLIHI